MVPLYPVLSDISGRTFEFVVALKYQGSETKAFDLSTTAPTGWQVSITPEYETKEIRAIGLEPGKQFPDRVKITFAPLAWELPEPGDYIVKFEAASGNIRESIDLKAVVIAQYRFAFFTTSGMLNTKVTAGQENHLSVQVMNTGTATIETIDFLSSKPAGWNVDFEPDEIDSLEPGFAQEIDVIIKPPSKTIAGDYAVELQALSIQARDSIELRVTALTPTIWGWVGIIVVLAVVAGLGVIFRRLGRR